MRKFFPEFNKPSEQEFKKIWEEATFIFDTNVLLSLYRLPQRSRKKLLTTLEKLKDRSWLPHQVALEYYRKRVEVIYDQEKLYSKILDLLEKNEQSVRTELEKYAKHPFIDSKKILKKFIAAHKTSLTEIEKAKSKHPNWLKDDTIEKELNKIFVDKVGIAYPYEQLKKIYADGQIRYDNEIPPGYKDKEKDKNDKTKTRKFGDLIIWLQIIDKAKESKKPIIFITDEQKEDWWWKIGGNTTVGPRYELVKEIKNQADVAFHMYQSDQFMEYVVEYSILKIDKELIEDVKKLREIRLADEENLVKTVESDITTSNELGGLGDVVVINTSAVITPCTNLEEPNIDIISNLSEQNIQREEGDNKLDIN